MAQIQGLGQPINPNPGNNNNGVNNVGNNVVNIGQGNIPKIISDALNILKKSKPKTNIAG